jgi:hypothetical protein
MPAWPISLADLVAQIETTTAGGSLDRLRTAVTVATELAAQGDELVGHFVEAARRDGRSWAQIGEQLGVTKQAAQQRFVATRPTATGMFRHFSDGARTVVARAEEDARALGHNYIGTEHLLLGLLGDPQTSAARALDAVGVSASLVRTCIEAIVGRATGVLADDIPFTPRSKRVFQLAADEAQDMNDPRVGPEHLLLGLLREGEGLAAKVLADLGATPVRLCAELSSLLGRTCRPGPPRRRRRRWR